VPYRDCRRCGRPLRSDGRRLDEEHPRGLAGSLGDHELQGPVSPSDQCEAGGVQPIERGHVDERPFASVDESVAREDGSEDPRGLLSECSSLPCTFVGRVCCGETPEEDRHTQHNDNEDMDVLEETGGSPLPPHGERMGERDRKSCVPAPGEIGYPTSSEPIYPHDGDAEDVEGELCFPRRRCNLLEAA